MIEGFRIVENQSKLYAYEATSSQKNAEYLESVLEMTKPPFPAGGWHKLIATPFRYPLPVPPKYQARFRPPFYFRNVLYCSEEISTVLHEHAYHFLKERIHLKGENEPGQRTLFSLFIHTDDITDIRTHARIQAIMNRTDYTESHRYIHGNPATKVLCYPSCREPRHGSNYAAFELSSLHKNIGHQEPISFYFNQATQSIQWLEWDLQISWNTIA